MVRLLHHRHHVPYLKSREAAVISDPQPIQFKAVISSHLSHAKSLFIRASSDSSNDPSDSSSTSDSSTGGKPTGGSNISLPVALGVIIPVTIAVVVFVYLHRRHVKRLRQEDANDPHKSLDFGWDPTSNTRLNTKGRNRKKEPEMVGMDLGIEKGPRPERGVSMDMDVGSPYLLPPGLQGSRESLHSLSRTVPNHDDRYRPATSRMPNDNSSLHSYKTRQTADDSSSVAGSGPVKRELRDDSQQGLLGNAQRMSTSLPLIDRGHVPQIQMPEPAVEVPRKASPSKAAISESAGLTPNVSHREVRESYQMEDDMRKSNKYLGAFIHSREQSAEIVSQNSEKGENSVAEDLRRNPSSTLQHTDNRKSPPPAISTSAHNSMHPEAQLLRASDKASIEQDFVDDGSAYGTAVRITPASPQGPQQEHKVPNRGSSQEYMPHVDEFSVGITGHDSGYDLRRLSMGVRPLPPDDPTDNPEQRANRIRSFYKEYFDDSKPGPVPGAYYEDYDENYLDDGATFDPASGRFVMAGDPPYAPPYAEPYVRRAMTPPPRIGGRHHAATMSASSRLMPPGPRAYSSVSGGFIPSGRGPAKKNLPPPAALRLLPTPHLLKEDAFALPIDFAPPTSARERQAGRPESPRGGMRPYSPAVRPHTPLARSYDDLAVMPSPHLLRKSGTFTALDFAPPPRFRNADTASDAGSIRSNRSAMSARSQYAVRNGAYRVSRIPKGIVGTKDDLMGSLKPQWNMHNNTGTIGMPA
ncbi:MAG: hypothetical protein Q9163_000412 [Psora crenata]